MFVNRKNRKFGGFEDLFKYFCELDEFVRFIKLDITLYTVDSLQAFM